MVRGPISRRWPAPAKERSGSARDPILIERIYGALALTPRPLMLIAAGFGHYIMQVRMLKGIKRRAEWCGDKGLYHA